MKKEVNHYLRFIKTKLPLFILALLFNCVEFIQKTDKAKQMSVSTNGAVIEAEDKSFKLESGKSSEPPFYSYKVHNNACGFKWIDVGRFGAIILWPVIIPYTIGEHLACLFGSWEYFSEPNYQFPAPPIKMTDKSVTQWALEKGAKKVRINLKDGKESYYGMLMIFPVFNPITQAYESKYNYTVDLTQFDAQEVKGGKVVVIAEELGGSSLYGSAQFKKWILWISDQPF